MRSTIARATVLSGLLIGLLCVASAAIAQPAAVTIRGRVVAEDNGVPLRRALITPPGAVRRPRQVPTADVRPVLTDEDGRFEIRVPDAAAPLTIAKAGFAVTKVSPPRRSNADEPLVVRMRRAGVVTGRIIDSNGEFAIGTRVMARLRLASS